eukprot:COSAG02_NODE_26110_length_640_cov_2.097967_1_plen_121_part_00
MHNRYDAGAPLTVEMINQIDWLHSDETTDFRNSAVENDNIPGQLVAVLKGSAMPELHRDYAFSNMASVPVTSEEALPDTYVDERRSYCESCGTRKRGVQWWTMPFQTRKSPLRALCRKRR